MRTQTWQVLDDRFSESPFLRAEGVSPVEVADAEREVGVKLAEDYKEFIRRYGGAIVGPYPIFGLRKADPMGDDESTFLEVTIFNPAAALAWRREMGRHFNGPCRQSSRSRCQGRGLDI